MGRHEAKKNQIGKGNEKKTAQDLKMKTEAIKKTQIEGILEMVSICTDICVFFFLHHVMKY